MAAIHDLTIGGGRQGTGRRLGHARRWSPARRGMTLVEVLVAMSVLLVGIWGVAKGFPLLMRQVREEGRRSQMVELAKRNMELLLANPAGLPLIVSGGPNVSPQMTPLDPDSFSPAENPPNSRDDWNRVVGERGVVPSVLAGVAPGTPVRYALKIGRANPSMAPNVSEVRQLAALLGSPPGAVPTDCFYLAGNGTIAADPAVRSMEISYAWLDNSGVTHWVQRESVALGGANQVLAAAAPSFSGIVEGSAWGASLIDYAILAPGSVVGAGEAALDTTGALLELNAADSGKTVQISYDLQVEESTFGRRARELFEDQVLSDANATSDPADATFSFVTVQLTATGLNGDAVLNTDPAALNTHVLAVDLATGALYYENQGIDPDTGLDYDKGKVTLRVANSPIGARALGHTFRFFYRTIDDGMMTVMRAPECYLPSSLFAGIAPVQQFDVLAANLGGFTVLDFTTGIDPVTTQPVSVSAGATVAVDYTYGDPNNPQRAVGELHTISISERQITLNNPGVLSVIAVRGISLKVRAWWRAQNGRLQYVDVDNLASPTGSA